MQLLKGGGIMEYGMLIMWVVLLVVFIVIEAITAQLTTIWFAIGSFAAIIAEMLDAPDWLQWVVFAVVSAIAVVVTRPFVKKITAKQMQPTNADRCIGQTAIVTEEIDNIAGKGAATVGGITWTARSEDGSTIAKDSKVTVTRIEGVKLIVKA